MRRWGWSLILLRLRNHRLQKFIDVSAISKGISKTFVVFEAGPPGFHLIEFKFVLLNCLNNQSLIMDIGQLYLKSVINRFNDYKNLGDRTFVQLNDADMHYQPDKESNSIAVIIQHLHGNMLSRWTNFLTEDGEKEWRQRDEEFELHNFSKDELLKCWEQGWNVLLTAISSLKSEDLGKTILIRKEPHTVIDAINRQLAHVPSHIGQIVYLGKHIRQESWKTLSIPKKGSAAFNEKMMGKKL